MEHIATQKLLTQDPWAAPIPEQEIASLRQAVNSGMPMLPWPFLKHGQRVRVECGALRGIEGTLARDPEGMRVVVSVHALQRSVAVQVDRDMIRPI